MPYNLGMSDWNDETAEWYAKKYGDYPTNYLGVNALDLSDGLTLVDIGCGTGAALRHAATKISGGKFIGVDPVPRMVEIACELTAQHPAHNKIEFRIGSAEDLPIEDSVADYILAFDSIDHWQDVEQGLREVNRILNARGIFAIVKDQSVPGAKSAIESLLNKLESAGFELIEEKEISLESVNFILLVLKRK